MTCLLMRNLSLAGKRVVIREDFNVPMEGGKITSDARIRAALPTIQQALRAGAAVILMSHLGRPTEGQYDPQLSLLPIAQHLELLLKHPVKFIADMQEPFTIEPGQIALLENVRFNVGEKQDDDILALRYAALADVFVMDAFGTAHRAEASTCGIARYAPIACAGPLLEAELVALTRAMETPKKPLLALIGGSKASTKLAVLSRLAEMVDVLILGGGIANTFLVAAGYSVGQSLYEPEQVDAAKALIAYCLQKGVQLPLPVDVVVAERFSESAIATLRDVADVGAHELILDIGPRTAALYASLIKDAKTIIWNGPVGVFEMPQFAEGTRTIAEAIRESSAFTLAGGGDTIAAVEQYHIQSAIGYLSTGGGAFLEFLEGKPLPALVVLEERYDALSEPH